MQTVDVRRGFYEIWELHDLIQRVAPDQAWIAGGYAAYMASAAPCPPAPGDVDVFPRSNDAFGKLYDALMACGVITSNSYRAITFSLDDGLPVQLIHPFAATECPEKLIDDFDFTVCQAVLVSKRCVMVGHNFLADTRAMRLAFNKIKNPLGAMVRLAKYSQKGYCVSPAELVKVLVSFQDGSHQAREQLIQYWSDFDNERWDQVRDDEPFVDDEWYSSDYYDG